MFPDIVYKAEQECYFAVIPVLHLDFRMDIHNPQGQDLQPHFCTSMDGTADIFGNLSLL